MSNYSTNVSDSRWQFIEEYLDNGRKRKYDLKELLKVILYVVKTGCQWRMLPQDFPKWQLVYYYYRKWMDAELFDKILDKLQSKVLVSKNQNPLGTL
jgi:transposase